MLKPRFIYDHRFCTNCKLLERARSPIGVDLICPMSLARSGFNPSGITTSSSSLFVDVSGDSKSVEVNELLLASLISGS